MDSDARNIDKVNELLKLLPDGWYDSSWHHDESDSVSLDIEGTEERYAIWVVSPEDNHYEGKGLFHYSLQTDEEVLIKDCELVEFLEKFKLINLCK